LMPAWCPGGRTTQNAFRQRPATTCGSNEFTCKLRARVPSRTRHTCPLPRIPAHVAREHATRHAPAGAQHCTTLREHNSAPVGCLMRCAVRRCGSHAYAYDAAPRRRRGTRRRRRTVRLCTTPATSPSRVCVCARACVRVSACVCVCARACARERARVCANRHGRDGSFRCRRGDLVEERVAHQRVLALCLGHVPDLCVASRRRCTGTGTR
jgi:hypothetical protein